MAEDMELEVVTFVERRYCWFKQLTVVIQLYLGTSPQLPILIDSELNLTHRVLDLSVVFDNLKFKYAMEMVSSCVQLWGLIGVDLIQHMLSVEVVRCLNGAVWQIPAGIISIRNTKHFLYDDQIDSIGPNFEIPIYDEIIKCYSCDDSLVNSLNSVPSYSDPFLTSLKRVE